MDVDPDQLPAGRGRCSASAASPRNPSAPAGGVTGGLMLVFLSLGISIIACCLLIPQADENRRLFWEAEKLRTDLDHITRQVETNEEFVRRLGHDPALAERLAQRHMNFIREGTGVLDLADSSTAAGRSPFLLVTLPPPPPMPEFQLKEGRIADLCREPRTRLYLLGGALMLAAAGLVLGAKDA